MKYFTYQLYPIGEGEAITPASYLPENSLIGLYSDTPYYFYGCAEIESLDIISKFNPVEITKGEFDVVSASFFDNQKPFSYPQ